MSRLRGSRRIGNNHERSAGFVPPSEIVEVRILTIGHEVQHWLLGGKENCETAVQFLAKRRAPCVVGRDRLLF